MPTDSYEATSGAEKAAVLMLALGEDHAAKLLSRLEIDEVAAISRTMSHLGRVEADLVERLLRDFGQLVAAPGDVTGGLETTEKFLGRFLDAPKVESIMEGIRGPAGRTVWDKLGKVDEATLASYLGHEHPQTVAVVLARIEPAHAARVLASLSGELSIDVMLRMLNAEVVRKDVLADVERTLRAEFLGGLARGNRRDGHEAVADIFNYFDRGTEGRLIASLEERDKGAAERVRALMFTFEDLAKLDGAGVQALLRSAGNDRIGVALKGASEKLKELFFANMSERAAKILKEDMQSAGPVRLRDVEEAQLTLVNKAKELVASGEVFLAGSSDDQLVY